MDEIVTNLKKIVQAEKIYADDDALIQIARQSAGGMRDAISLLDQLSSTGDRITLSLAQTVLGTATSQTVLNVISSINEHDPAHGLETIHKALDAEVDPRSLARQIVEYLRGLMLIQMGNIGQVEATADVKKQMQSHAHSFTTGDVLRMMKVFNNAATDLRGGWQPSLSLELALAEALDAPSQLLHNLLLLSIQNLSLPQQLSRLWVKEGRRYLHKSPLLRRLLTPKLHLLQRTLPLTRVTSSRPGSICLQHFQSRRPIFRH